MFGRIRSTSGSTKYLSTLAMAFALVMGIACFYSCGKPEEPKPVDPVNPTPPVDKDTKAPEITLKVTELNVYGGKVVTIDTGKLTIGETEVATWSDDKSAADKCTVALSFAEAGTKATAEAATDNDPDTKAETKAGTAIKSGDTLDKAGTLTITVTDEANNSASKDITLTVKPLEYNAVTPAKAESMYQKFNTTNDRAFERWGAYETKALAQSLKNRNTCKVLIFREGAYTPGESDIHERRGGDGDGHGEEVYRNIAEGSGTTNDILATRLTTRIDVENNINNSSLKGHPLIITTSKEVLGRETLDEFLNNPEYKAFNIMGNDPNILTFASGGNVKNNFNYVLHESITNKSDFGSGGYEQSSATDTNNGIVRVEHGISKDISKHGVGIGKHNTTSCAFISKDNYIISRNVISLPKNKTRNDSEEWTVNNTSFAAPAAAAMARNVYDICKPLGIIENLQDTRFLIEKYATKVPSTREDIAADGTIIEDVPNGYVYTPNLLALIDNEIIPAIENKCVSENGEFTSLYTYDGLRLAYQGAGVEYQDSDGNWYDTNGINPKEYVDRPQRISYALRHKYGNQGGITMYLMVPDGVLDYGDRKGGYIVKKEDACIPTG